MAIKRIKSGGIFEDKVGYCRAVIANGMVFVAGTTAQGSDIPEDVVGQCQSAIEAISNALVNAGASLADVVRVTYYLPEASDFESCWPVLRDAFGANPPAGTMVSCDLIDPKYKIEIEVTAVLPV